ncbi:MAG: hypothetical protein KUG58_08875, partial [Marinosulfonomonas sp.]|nr:hypothetical protein [Marinosulfonomonas sp.]
LTRQAVWIFRALLAVVPLLPSFNGLDITGACAAFKAGNDAQAIYRITSSPTLPLSRWFFTELSMKDLMLPDKLSVSQIPSSFGASGVC